MTKTKWLSRHKDGRHFVVGGKARLPPKKWVGKADPKFSTYVVPSTKEWSGMKLDYRYIEGVAQKMLSQGYDAKTIEKILSKASKMKDISFNDIVMKIQLPMAAEKETDIDTLDTFAGRLIKYDIRKGGKVPTSYFQEKAYEIARKIGLKRVPKVVVMPTRGTAAGWFSQSEGKVFIGGRGDISQLEVALAHELGHAKQHEDKESGIIDRTTYGEIGAIRTSKPFAKTRQAKWYVSAHRAVIMHPKTLRVE